ncbi:hypothetical protein XELAEV_18010474mg [Xenopus laevis]|uniref:Uncharacterized protein n=1 Tax=Xenopus laevis TaxID=8355 RepID=A0A974DUK6_XENLA|nr:hypothetical protein XELAEV_18010474mg [Xenopus laevis]
MIPAPWSLCPTLQSALCLITLIIISPLLGCWSLISLLNPPCLCPPTMCPSRVPTPSSSDIILHLLIEY